MFFILLSGCSNMIEWYSKTFMLYIKTEEIRLWIDVLMFSEFICFQYILFNMTHFRYFCSVNLCCFMMLLIQI